MYLYLQESLLQALHGISDKALPVAGGVLWNAHLLPARRAGVHLDLKTSSYKKLSKLLQVGLKRNATPFFRCCLISMLSPPVLQTCMTYHTPLCMCRGHGGCFLCQSWISTDTPMQL